jgi:L-cysteine S-thiosulfotransferase
MLLLLACAAAEAQIGTMAPLADQTGDPARGKEIVLDPERGNCLICHAAPIAEAEFQGDVGPDLAGVGSRYDAGELRLRVVDARRLNPASVMPAYHRTDGLHRVLKEYRGKPILTRQEVEDVVAYLMTLTEER